MSSSRSFLGYNNEFDQIIAWSLNIYIGTFNNLQWGEYLQCLSSFKDNPALTSAKLKCSSSSQISLFLLHSTISVKVG